MIGSSQVVDPLSNGQSVNYMPADMFIRLNFTVPLQQRPWC